MKRYKSLFAEKSDSVQEYGSFEDYKKDVISKLKIIFKKYDDSEKFSDTPLLGRDKSRKDNSASHWSITQALTDIAKKEALNLNIVFRNNPKNVSRVIFKRPNGDDAFYTYIMIPNYSMHEKLIEEIQKKVIDEASRTELQQYDTSTRIRTTPFKDREPSNPDMELEGY
jgi:hypothetical protein